ncbi:T9SS type A sorting domain-containing protein [Salibacter halophilus]|uniref:T9SS type A sorting domain-containing protein n=1 Tax=Salibacter halophilus TaxID=1803916 RepID=A0A6N6M8N0_9FLAO|nr:T9SS type A sorting domain-containing protein [Salibacter halophilus]KAB1063467.1 T9SS type A sorting domain-containing protein [Salibacter halophilus]
MKYFIEKSIFLIFLLATVTAHTQSVIYQNERDHVEIEKYFDDGSIHISYLNNDTFYLDSVSPAGQYINLINVELSNEGEYYTRYNYNEDYGIFTSRSVPDTSYSPAEVSFLQLSRYSKAGSLIWQKEVNPGELYGNGQHYLLSVLDDTLYAYGSTSEVGECVPKAVFISLLTDGQILKNKIMGECTDVRFVKSENGFTFQFSQMCSCGNSPPRPAKISYFNHNLEKENELVVSGENTPFVEDDKIITHFKFLSESTYFGSATLQHSSDEDPVIGSNYNGSMKWLSLSNFTTYTYDDEYQANGEVYDVIKYDNGYLLFYGAGFHNGSFDSTILFLDYVDQTVSYDIPLWQYTSTGDHEIGFLYAHENDVFLQTTKREGDINNWIRQRHFWRVNIPETWQGQKRKVELPPKLKIFPNPANNFVIIETLTSSELTMFSSTGQLIRERDLNIGQNRLSLTGLASGVYFLRCNSEITGSEVKKLIIR